MLADAYLEGKVTAQELWDRTVAFSQAEKDAVLLYLLANVLTGLVETNELLEARMQGVGNG
jgi:hypothetical protein